MNLYHPRYSPWEEFEVPLWTIVSKDRCYVIDLLARQARQTVNGEFWECGVYKGGTAMLLAKVLEDSRRTLRLFDTFEGMPEADPTKDSHVIGDFADTTLEDVKRRVHYDDVKYHKGLIPETFAGLEIQSVAFAHIDVDLYSSVRSCCSFIFPRLMYGGFMVFDDYGFPTCKGAKEAVDDYFSDKNVIPLVLHTGQALVFKP